MTDPTNPFAPLDNHGWLRIDTSAEAVALACMIVSNPGGNIRPEGWQRRVNDLLRALQQERDDTHADAQEAIAKLDATMKDWAFILAERDKTFALMLERAEKAESLIAECAEYLKEGETPKQRMDRDHADVLSLMEMLTTDRKRRDEAEARCQVLEAVIQEYSLKNLPDLTFAYLSGFREGSKTDKKD